jgi:S1-C subfamily serine protease
MNRLKSLLPAVIAMLASDSTFGGGAKAGKHGALGVSMSDRPNDTAAGGVMIEYIYPSSPAAQIGLLPRDRIFSVASQPVSDYRDVIRLVSANAPYAQIKLGVARGSWRGTITATLGPARKVLRVTQAQAPFDVGTSQNGRPGWR